jgi:hypothetical protein
MANGRVDLKRIQRASRSVEGVSKTGLSVQDKFQHRTTAQIRTMNWHETTTFEHHALREGLLVMVDIVKRDIAQIWGKLICCTVIGLKKDISGCFRIADQLTTRMVRLKETVSAFSSAPW